MNNEILWNNDESISEYGFKQPEWITEDLDSCQVASILQGGCESGAYMPAVTYYKAADTMNKYGDDVLDYLEDVYGEIPPPKDGESWSGMAVHYLSMAVEAYCIEIEQELIDKIEEAQEEED